MLLKQLSPREWFCRNLVLLSGGWNSGKANFWRKFTFFLSALILWFGLCIGSAEAAPPPPDNVFYGESGTTIYTINLTTGATTSVGTLAYVSNGIARDPISGRIYYVDPAASPGKPAYWDPTTGSNTTLSASLGFGTNRLTFRSDGVLFTMDPATNNIYTIDLVTGAPTLVASVIGPPLNGGGDMAFSPSGQLFIVTNTSLYAVQGNISAPPVGPGPALSTIATSTGAASAITGLVFGSDGLLYGSSGTNLIRINPAGGSTIVGSTVAGLSDLGAATRFADISITKTASSLVFPRLNNVSYLLKVSNSGPQSASGPLTVTDTLPSGLTYASGIGTNWACSAVAQVVTCTNSTASLVSGASLPDITITVNVAAGTPNSVSNTATADSTTVDPNTTNNSTTIANSVGAPAISKSFSTSPIAPNGTSTLTLTLTNATPTSFTGVTFTDTFPSGLTVAAAPALTNTCGGTITGGAAGNNNIGLNAGNLAANGGTCTITVVVTAATPGSYANSSGGATTAQTGVGPGAVSNTATLVVLTPASITKAFSQSPILPGGTATLTFTITNPNASTPLAGVAFTDAFPTAPGAMVVAATPNATTNSCGTPTFSPTAGSASISFSAGSLVGGGTCTASVNITAPTGGTYNNTSSGVSTTNAGTGSPASASLIVSAVVPPSMAKAFAPNPIAPNGTSTLTFTITNPNPSTALTGVAFSDTFPTSPGAMRVAATPSASTSGCGTPTFAPAANSASISFASGSIVGGGTCTVRVNITVPAVGSYANTSGAVSSTNGGTGNTANATLFTLAPAVLNKTFTPSTIGINGTSTLTFTITNPNATTTLTNVTFSDTFPTTPGAMRVANPPAVNISSGCGTPTFSPAAGSGSVSFSGGTLTGGGGCTVTVNVTAPTAGTYSNTTSTVTTANTGPGVAATATLTVISVAPPTISKSFAPDPIAIDAPTTLTFTLTNPNPATALNGVAFADTFPTIPGAMVVAAAPSVSTSGCGTPTFSPTAGSASIAFSAGTIAANATCTVKVNVVAPIVGTYSNISGAVSSTNGGTGSTAADSLTALSPPTLSKTFLPNSVPAGSPTTLMFTLTNPNASTTLTGIQFSDTFPTLPAAMVVTTTPNASTSGCGTPTFTPTAGSASISFSGGSIASGATCTVLVDVTAATAGTYNNTSSNISSTNGGTGGTASATATFTASPPRMRLVKRVTAINRNGVNVLPTTYIDVNGGTGSSDDNVPGWPNLPALVSATLEPGPGTNPNFSPFLQGIVIHSDARPNDEVEYTIYFLSDGGRDAGNAKLCDFIPSNSTYVANGLQLAIGSGTANTLTDIVDTDSGRFIADPGPFDAACTSTNNLKGAAFVNVGTVLKSAGPGVPAASYGFMRFKARVN
jgi:uncharacterized repeat protein (TIGR01451 family)